MLRKRTTNANSIIQYFHLDATLKFDFSRSISEGFYGIFFWKDIVLGECYLEPVFQQDSIEVRMKIWKSISKVISSYNPDEVGFKMLQAAFLSQDQMWFEEEMEKLFFKLAGNLFFENRISLS